jgi:ribosome recycling factor
MYGSRMPINGLATANIADARSIIIVPWDKNSLKDIEKAIAAANLGVSAVNEGDKLRLTVPQLTEENRKELVKKLNEKMEEARISLRQVRDEVKTEIEQAFDNKEVSEDDKFRFLKELDEEMIRLNADLKAFRDKKDVEIMTI